MRVLSADRRWTRLVEAIAIVASILFAFSIDAWWSARADRETHQSALTATGQLLAMIRPNPQFEGDTAEISRILTPCLTNPTFIAAQGATNSLIASGDLPLIDDAEFQSMLTQWSVSAGQIREWLEIERHHGAELIPGPTFDFIAWPDVTFAMGLSEQPSAFDSDYHALFSSHRFEGLLTNRQWNLGEVVANIAQVEAATTQLIERLESRRALL